MKSIYRRLDVDIRGQAVTRQRARSPGKLNTSPTSQRKRGPGIPEPRPANAPLRHPVSLDQGDGTRPSIRFDE
jgi:hypothetical protein